MDDIVRVLAGVLLLLTGCTFWHGQQAEDFLPFAGAVVEVELDDQDGSRERGQLLAVDAGALLVLSMSGGEITSIGWDAVRRVRFTDQPVPSIEGRPTQDQIVAAGRVARFAHGVSPDILASLLAIQGQNSLRVIRDSSAAVPLDEEIGANEPGFTAISAAPPGAE